MKDDLSLRPSRRRFLQMSLSLSLAAAGIGLPFRVLAARDPIADKLKSPDVRQNLEGLTPDRKPRAPRLLMLDPGHGGHDPGAIGKHGTMEKGVTLDIARRIASLLEENGEVKVRLTRDDDSFIPLPERVRLAREARADLFVSIHADSAPTPSARGLSAYTLSEKASDAFASALATQENRIEAMGVDLGQADKDVAAILVELTARRTREISQKARYIFVQRMGQRWHLLERPMRDANFAVLRAPDVPSFLVETGFLSNPQDEATLARPQERQRIAKMMADEMGVILGGALFA